MKFKNLSKEQILISVDRLTRFKNTKEKYLRVFSDILIECLIEPKFKKSDILNMDYGEITQIAEEIINTGLSEINCRIKPNYDINYIIKNYENSIYYNDNEIQKFLNNKINFNAVIDLIAKDSSINLLWLKCLIENYTMHDLKFLREAYVLKYPIEKVILAEGITEEILLPEFSKYLGKDFNKNGVQIIAAGGKNQVVKMYYKLINEIKLPIYILLDKDAEENINQIKPKLRKTDKIHTVTCGEFEDLLPKSLIIKTINKHFENFLTVSETDLISDLPTAKVLSELFRLKGLHEFKKADFAKLVRDNINEPSDISEEIKNIINELNN